MGKSKKDDEIIFKKNRDKINSRRIFYNYNDLLPRDPKMIEEEEKKSPKDLPPLKLLEAINGFSTIYAETADPTLHQQFDASGLLCLGLLIEEQLKNDVIGFDEKYQFATDCIKKEVMENNSPENSE